MLFCSVSERARLEILGKPQEMQQDPRSLVKEGLSPPQCAFVSLLLPLASALCPLFRIPLGSPLAANGAPPGELHQPGKSLPRLLPIYPTGTAFQGTPGGSNQIKSPPALRVLHLHSPSSEETLQRPNSGASGMRKQASRLLCPLWCTGGSGTRRVQCAQRLHV